jgi:hypothetical protein
LPDQELINIIKRNPSHNYLNELLEIYFK